MFLIRPRPLALLSSLTLLSCFDQANSLPFEVGDLVLKVYPHSVTVSQVAEHCANPVAKWPPWRLENESIRIEAIQGSWYMAQEPGKDGGLHEVWHPVHDLRSVIVCPR